MALAITQGGNTACYVHIPKTGGVWIEKVLTEIGLGVQWAPADPTAHKRHACRTHLVRSYDSYFTVVRHPKAWYESWWKFFYDSKWDAVEHDLCAWHPQHCIVDCMSTDFGTFVSRTLDKFPGGYVRWMYWTYCGKSPKFGGRWKIPFIGKTEKLASELVRLLRHCKIRLSQSQTRAVLDYPRRNVSGSPHGDPVWPPGLYRRMCRAERRVFQEYRYAE